MNYPSFCTCHPETEAENLDDETDNFIEPEEKQVSEVIQDVTGIGNVNAQAIISVIGSDMSLFQRTNSFHLGRDNVPEVTKALKKENLAKSEKEMLT